MTILGEGWGINAKQFQCDSWNNSWRTSQIDLSKTKFPSNIKESLILNLHVHDLTSQVRMRSLLKRYWRRDDNKMVHTNRYSVVGVHTHCTSQASIVRWRRCASSATLSSSPRVSHCHRQRRRSGKDEQQTYA